MKKEDVPLLVLLSFQKVKKNLIEIVGNEGDLKIYSEDLLFIKIISSKPDSIFSFSILSCNLEKQIPLFDIRFNPVNNTTIESATVKASQEQTLQFFASWYNLIKTYNSIPSSRTEEILNSNQQRLLKEYIILDDDASHTSFNWHQQIYLDEYLQSAIDKLELMKNLDNYVEEIEPLQVDALKIKSIITKETKKEVFERLSRFWAKAQVIGLDIFKELFVSYISELTMKLL